MTNYRKKHTIGIFEGKYVKKKRYVYPYKRGAIYSHKDIAYFLLFVKSVWRCLFQILYAEMFAKIGYYFQGPLFLEFNSNMKLGDELI